MLAMEGLFDSLSEDWVSQPRSNGADSSPRSLSFAGSTVSQQGRAPQSRIPRAISAAPSSPSTDISVSRQPRISTKKPVGPNGPLKEVTASHINASINKASLKKASPAKNQDKAGTKPTGKSSASPGQDTVQRKAGSVVTPKSQRPLGTPDWKRRLKKDIAEGQVQDLFSPTGLEGVFRPPVSSVVVEKKSRTSMIRNGDLRSSPPPYPSSSLAAFEPQHEQAQRPCLPVLRKGIQSAQSKKIAERDIPHPETYPSSKSSKASNSQSEVSVNRPDNNEVSVCDIQDGDPSQQDLSEEYMISKNERNVTLDTSHRYNREISGKTDDLNENISPYYVSRHNTVDGQVDYAPIDLSMSQLRLQMDKARQQQQYRFPPSASDNGMNYSESRHEPSVNVPCSDWQNQSLPDDLSTGTVAFTLNGGYVTTRRGALSNESSFMRRSLSPSSQQRSSRLGKRRSLSVGASAKGSSSVGDFSRTPGTPERSDIKHCYDPSTSLSPLKLFGHHDTFTNDRLLRRLGNLNDKSSLESKTPPDADGIRIHATDPEEQREPSRCFTFGKVELRNHDFDTSNLSSCQLASRTRKGGKGGSSAIQRNSNTGEANGSARSQTFNIYSEIELTAQGKRPSHSPLKDPGPKRRRTLQQVLEDRLFPYNESNRASFSISKPPAQSVVGRKRKDALHGKKSETADPDVLALRQILRPRTLTQSQSFPQTRNTRQRLPSSGRTPVEGEMASNSANGPLAGELTNIDVDMVQHVVSDDSRKPSVTTADFHKEAQQVMQLLRMQGRPLARLPEQSSNEQEHPSNNEVFFDHDSTRDNFSRPPSREGSRPRELKERARANVRVISQLQKFKEDDEPGIILSSSLKSLKLTQHISGQRETAANAQSSDPQASQEDEERKHDSIQSRASSDPSTQRSVPTNSSQSSKGKAVIPPEAVAHLLGTDVAGMTFDHANQRWVKCKSMKRSQKAGLSPYPGSILTEEDVFARISDLSTEDLEEEQWQNQGHEEAYQSGDDLISSISRHDHAPRRDPRYSTSSRPHTADGAQSDTLEASSAPSKFSHYASSGPAPDTRATSWGDEAFRSKISIRREQTNKQVIHRSLDEGLEEDVEHEISILDGREPNLSSSPRRAQHQQPRVVTVSFSSPLESHWDKNDTEAGCGTEKSTKRYSGGVVSGGGRRRRIPITHRQHSATRKSYCRLTKGCHDFAPRPMSRLDEHEEDNATRSLSQASDADMQIALSTPLSRNHSAADQLTLGGQLSSTGFQLTPLSAFTAHPHDTSLDIEGDYLARRVGRDVTRNGSLATQELVKKLQDVQPEEPYWDYLPSLVLRDQRLSTLHLLDEFCGSLVKLDVSRNSLGEVNGAPSTVRHLKVAHNMLSDLTSWTHLRDLQYLDVSGNQLTNLQGFRGLVHLRELQADDNKIESLDGIEMLDGLMYLSLRNNVIKELDFDGCEL